MVSVKKTEKTVEDIRILNRFFQFSTDKRSVESSVERSVERIKDPLRVPLSYCTCRTQLRLSIFQEDARRRRTP
jgi:hypothetical protein